MIWILLLAGLVLLAWQSGTLSTGISTVSKIIGFDPSKLSSPGVNEEQDILRVANATGVDARLLSAIRMQENGAPGREYGILGVYAPSIQDQLQISANTIRNTVTRYAQDTGQSAIGPDGRCTVDFITYLGNGGPSYGGYAPVGAPNDPGSLNQYWVPNVIDNYNGTEIV